MPYRCCRPVSVQTGLDAAHVAFLVDTDQEDDMARVIENLAHDWRGWIEVRLTGPMAAYDFVGTA